MTAPTALPKLAQCFLFTITSFGDVSAEVDLRGAAVVVLRVHVVALRVTVGRAFYQTRSDGIRLRGSPHFVCSRRSSRSGRLLRPALRTAVTTHRRTAGEGMATQTTARSITASTSPESLGFEGREPT